MSKKAINSKVRLGQINLKNLIMCRFKNSIKLQVGLLLRLVPNMLWQRQFLHNSLYGHKTTYLPTEISKSIFLLTKLFRYPPVE